MSAAIPYQKLTDIVDANIRSKQELPAGIVLARGSDLKPEPVSWLWKHWLALSKFHILAGAPGQGKTTIALAIMALITRGGRWPDGSRCSVGNVLMWSGEDDPADTLLPRLLAAGADVSRVFFITGARINGEVVPFDPARDLIELATKAAEIGDVRLLVVDPVVSAITGDSHKNTEVRRGLQPLVDLANSLNAAVLGISHFTKGSAGRDPTERVTGSVAFGAVARVVMVAAKTKTDDGDDRRIFARSKSNIGPDDGGFEYTLQQTEPIAGIEASCIAWGQALPGTARDLLKDAEAEPDSDGGSDINDFINKLLEDGPVSAKTIKEEANEAGYAWRSVQRAADRLGVARRKDGMQGGWYWWPASKAPKNSEGAEDANSKRVAPSASSVASSSAPDVEVF